MVKCIRFRAIPGLLLVGLFLALASGCLLSPASVAVLSGNADASQGRDQDAILKFLDTSRASAWEAPWLAYNLGNVYYGLGEKEAALRAWERAAETSDKELRFAVLFNQAYVWYESGNYPLALEYLQGACTLMPDDLDAKILLETVWLKLQAAQRHTQPTGGAPESAADNPDDEFGRLYDYVLRKEVRIWQDSAPSGGTTSPANDW